MIPMGGSWKGNVGGTVSNCLLKMASFVVGHNCLQSCDAIFCYSMLHIAVALQCLLFIVMVDCCCTADYCTNFLCECALAAVCYLAPLLSSHPVLHGCFLVACCCCCIGEGYRLCCLDNVDVVRVQQHITMHSN